MVALSDWWIQRDTAGRAGDAADAGAGADDVQLVQSGELGELRATLTINTISLVVKPTPAVILTALVRYSPRRIIITK